MTTEPNATAPAATAATDAAATSDPHLKRFFAAFSKHHDAVTPLIQKVETLETENRELKAQIADYQGALDQASAYAEEQTAAVTATAPGAPSTQTASA